MSKLNPAILNAFGCYYNSDLLSADEDLFDNAKLLASKICNSGEDLQLLKLDVENLLSSNADLISQVSQVSIDWYYDEVCEKELYKILKEVLYALEYRINWEKGKNNF